MVKYFKYISWIVGFTVGISVGFGFEFLLLMMVEWIADRRYHPFGLGWVTLPIGLGLLFAQVSSTTSFRILILRLIGGPQQIRTYSAASVVWLLGVVGWLLIAEPYRHQYRIRVEDWIFLAKLCLIPPALLFAAFCVVVWATTNGKRK